MSDIRPYPCNQQLSDEQSSSTSKENPPRVLSVQSHVVSGYVGNKSAIFPLQLLGFDADFINSVQFSNHTGYPTVKGSVVNGEQLLELVSGLKSNSLLSYDYLLTGYIGSETFLSSILKLLDEIEATNPLARYVCDPVLGDEGRFYVPEALVGVFRERVVPRAYMVTPNQFEASLLTGLEIRNEGEAVRALTKLHEMGPKVVVLTSAVLDEFPGKLGCYLLSDESSATAEVDELQDVESTEASRKNLRISRVLVDKIDASFTGTGDASAALLLAWSHIEEMRANSVSLTLLSSDDPPQSETGARVSSSRGHSPFSSALVNTMATLQAIVQRTYSRQVERRALREEEIRAQIEKNKEKDADVGEATTAGGEDTEVIERALRARNQELCLIESRWDILSPPLDRSEISCTSWLI